MDNLFPWTPIGGRSATVVNLPVLEGSTVYLLVKATNGAELDTTAVADLTILFGDGSPPPQATVATDPALYLADGSELGISWAAVGDPDSGVIGYEYGIGTSAAIANVLSWIPVSSPRTPYLLGQGSTPGSGGAGSVEIEATDLSLAAGQTYYAVVKSINGSGLASIGASEAFIDDSTAPVDTALSAPDTSTDRDSLSIHLSARDSESGIAAYRFALWEITSLSEADGPVEYLPVGGFITGGQFKGTLNITGNVITDDSYSGMSSGEGPGPALEMEGGEFEVPPWAGDLEMSTPPWFESDWSLVTTGAPEGMDTRMLMDNLYLANSPNPFRQEPVIYYRFPSHQLDAGMAYLRIYDNHGNRLETLRIDQVPAGVQTFTWPGAVKEGVYIFGDCWNHRPTKYYQAIRYCTFAESGYFDALLKIPEVGGEGENIR